MKNSYVRNDPNHYDENGHTPLMNAAITGDLGEIERLLKAGADPDLKDGRYGSSRAQDFAARRAHQSDVHLQIRVALQDASRKAQKMATYRAVNADTPTIPNNDVIASATTWPHETIRSLQGQVVTRVRSSVFYLSGLLAFGAGLYLVSEEVFLGAFLILTIAPFLLLYPVVRFFFGGKDSLGAAVTTYIVEEVIKQSLLNAADRSSRKRR